MPSPLLTHFSFPICSLLSILLPPLCASSPFLSSKPAAQPPLVPIHSASPPPALPAGHSPLPPGSRLLQLRAQAQSLVDSYSGAERDSGGQGPAGALAREGCRARVRGNRGRGFSAAQPREREPRRSLPVEAGRSITWWSPAVRKEGWTDRRQRKPQGAEIKGAAQKQAGKELVSVPGWQEDPAQPLQGRARDCAVPPIFPPPPRAGEWVPSSLSAAQTLARN